MSRHTLRSVPTPRARLPIGERLELAGRFADRLVPELPRPLAVSAIHYLVADGITEQPTAAQIRERAAAIRARWERDWTTTTRGD